MCALLSLQITMLSANIMLHGASSLISSVIVSTLIANKQGLKADLWRSPEFASDAYVIPTVVFSSSCTIIMCFSDTLDFLMQYLISSLDTLPLSFLQVHTYTNSSFLPSLYFSSNALKAINASVVLSSGMLFPYVNTLLNLESIDCRRATVDIGKT